MIFYFHRLSTISSMKLRLSILKAAIPYHDCSQCLTIASRRSTVFFDEFMSKEDQHYKDLLALVGDPRGGKNPRLPFPLCIDSTKIGVQKSSDYEYQKQTYFIKKGQNYITMTNVSLPDGTILLYACASPSVSPSHGDSRILGRFIWKDNQAIDEGLGLPSGLAVLIKGTDKYFMAVFVDSGYVFEGRPMPIDDKIGTLIRS